MNYFKPHIYKVAAEILMKKKNHLWDVNVAGATAVIKRPETETKSYLDETHRSYFTASIL